MWRERSPGQYELKSRSHNPSQLQQDELVGLVRDGGSLEKGQYRYVLRHGNKPIHVPNDWLALFGKMNQWAKRYGPECVRLIGFFE